MSNLFELREPLSETFHSTRSPIDRLVANRPYPLPHSTPSAITGTNLCIQVVNYPRADHSPSCRVGNLRRQINALENVSPLKKILPSLPSHPHSPPPSEAKHLPATFPVTNVGYGAKKTDAVYIVLLHHLPRLHPPRVQRPSTD